jgi:hypothetical protein
MVSKADHVDEPVENLTQEEQFKAIVIGELEPGALNDYFDEGLDEDDDIGDGMNDISAGSEDDELDVASADEDDLTSGGCGGGRV